MNWHNLPGIKDKEEELAKIQIEKKKLDLQYLRACIYRHFPKEVTL